MKSVFFLLLLLFFHQTFSQVAINNNGNTPASSAMLDVSSTNKGVLITRMTSAQRKAIASPEMGLLVYDTDRQTIYLYDGQKWKPMVAGTESTAPLVSRQVDTKFNSGFGTSAGIYDNYAVVGAPNDSAQGIDGGAVYVFVKDGGNWELLQKLSAPNPLNGEEFGKSVSIHGDLLVVGSPDRTVGGLTFRGAVYVFKRLNRTWNFVTMLTASNGAGSDYFGTSVTTNGSYILAGAPYTDHSNKTNAGSVYVFGLQNGVWAQKFIINAGDAGNHAHFGYSLDIWQTKLAIGAPDAEIVNGFGNKTAGAVYIYHNTDANGFTWTLSKKIIPTVGHDEMKFGHSVAIEGIHLLCGGPQYSELPGQYTQAHRGRAFYYLFENGDWHFKLNLGEFNEENRSGEGVAISNGTLFSGMPGWKSGRGKVIMYNNTNPANILYRFYYDEDSNLNYDFGSVVAAHNGQFIITSPKEIIAGRVFFGVIE